MRFGRPRSTIPTIICPDGLLQRYDAEVVSGCLCRSLVATGLRTTTVIRRRGVIWLSVQVSRHCRAQAPCSIIQWRSHGGPPYSSGTANSQLEQTRADASGTANSQLVACSKVDLLQYGDFSGVKVQFDAEPRFKQSYAFESGETFSILNPVKTSLDTDLSDSQKTVPLVFRLDEGSSSSTCLERDTPICVQLYQSVLTKHKCSHKDPSCFKWIVTEHFLSCQFVHALLSFSTYAFLSF